MLLSVAAAMWLAAAPLSVDGGVPREVIEDVLRWNANALNACFQGTPRTALLQYRFGVSPAGNVGSLGFIDAKGLDGPRVTCLGTVVEQLAFPSSDAGTAVELTFKATSAFDAGTAEPELLPVAAFQEAWGTGVHRCHSKHRTGLGEGRLSLELWAGPSGAVVQALVAEAATSLQQAPFHACLTTEARHWTLGPGSGWRRRTVNLILGTSESAEKKFFDPKSPAAFVAVAGTPGAPNQGGLDKDVIHEVIRNRQSEIKFCYEMALARKPTLAGLVRVHFKIGPDGDVVETTVEDDTAGSAELLDCVKARIGKWKFPEPIGGGFVDVTYPWILKPVDEED